MSSSAVGAAALSQYTLLGTAYKMEGMTHVSRDCATGLRVHAFHRRSPDGGGPMAIEGQNPMGRERFAQETGRRGKATGRWSFQKDSGNSRLDPAVTLDGLRKEKDTVPQSWAAEGSG
jgi:hypothetical protein